MKSALSLLGFSILAAGLSGKAAAGEPAPLNVELRAASRELVVLHQGKPVLTYRFSPRPFKPYVSELFSMEGVNVLLDAPADHLHHHGLMYAIKLNGTNFWEESPQAGYQLTGPEVERKVGRGSDGRALAEFGHTVYWVPSKEVADPAAAAWLVEARQLAVRVDPDHREVALEWRSDFTVGPGTQRVTLGGAAYHGLGLRFIPAFDKTGRRQNAAGAAYTAEATWDLTDAPWASTSQTVGGRELTVTMFDDPANAGEPRFFSMLNGFAYLSATQALDLKPLEYAAGEKFRLRYLVTVHSGAVTGEFLGQRYAQWLKPH